MDLARWWRERRFRGLLDLIDQLPYASRLNQAVQNDPEQAVLIAQAREAMQYDDDAPVWTPPMREFDLHATMLRDVINLLAGIQHGLAGSSKPPPEYPRPVTEVDRAMARLQRTWAVGILSRFGFSEDDI